MGQGRERLWSGLLHCPRDPARWKTPRRGRKPAQPASCRVGGLPQFERHPVSRLINLAVTHGIASPKAAYHPQSIVSDPVCTQAQHTHRRHPAHRRVDAVVGRRAIEQVTTASTSDRQVREEGLRILWIELRGLHLGSEGLLLWRRNNQSERFIGRVVKNLTEHLRSYEDAVIWWPRDCGFADSHAPETFQ